MPRCTWLYVLSDEREDFMYVGMTYRLVSRLNEHISGAGARVTSTWNYNVIQAIYKIDVEECHHHNLEDDLTLKLMKGRGVAWWKIRGGKWHQVGPIPKPEALRDMRHYPETCCCHFPVAEKVGKSGRAYMCCPRKGIEWYDDKVDSAYKFAEAECDYFRWADED
jgi:hypothetical protein